uniref:DUF3456 domain-containing protein n=1 Tax=Timema poppense TaxID=170557 RepID=A0A7R9CQS0_TIMPO|nr:unnamed protein product [Timema poppensis]
MTLCQPMISVITGQMEKPHPPPWPASISGRSWLLPRVPDANGPNQPSQNRLPTPIHSQTDNLNIDLSSLWIKPSCLMPGCCHEEHPVKGGSRASCPIRSKSRHMECASTWPGDKTQPGQTLEEEEGVREEKLSATIPMMQLVSGKVPAGGNEHARPIRYHVGKWIKRLITAKCQQVLIVMRKASCSIMRLSHKLVPALRSRQHVRILIFRHESNPDQKSICRSVVEEIENIIQKVDPRKKVDVGSYRLDSKGNQKQKSVPYARSEVHLTEVMETVCNKMDDYVKATYKTSGELTLLRLVTDDGKMNSLMSEVDIVQDSDLNKSLKFYCEGIVEEYEDNFLKLFAKDVANIDIKLCSDDIHLCSQTEPDDDYEFEDKDEL